jgi:hypothetical protein
MGFAVQYTKVERQQGKNKYQETGPDEYHKFLLFLKRVARVEVRVSAFNKRL